MVQPITQVWHLYALRTDEPTVPVRTIELSKTIAASEKSHKVKKTDVVLHLLILCWYREPDLNRHVLMDIRF